MKGLRTKRAEGYVDVAVAVLVVSFLLVLLVSVFGLVSKKQDLRYMASELIDTATVSGSVGQEVQKRYAQLCEETGLHPSVNWIAAYYDAATGKVQLGDVISVSLETETSILGFGGVLFPVKLTATASGLSEIYWK